MDLKCKVSILGDEQIGKTSLILRFIKNTFDSNYKATLGADFIDKEFTSDDLTDLKPDDKFTLTYWDIAGQKHFNEISSVYIHGSAAIILVFDLTNPKSVEAIPKWKSMGDQACNDPIYVLLGNKSDLYTPSEDEIKEIEEKIGLPVELTSAKTAENVSNAFEQLAKNILFKFLGQNKRKRKQL